MPLDDLFGAVDPQAVETGLIGKREPDLVHNGSVDPQEVLNYLIRSRLRGRPKPASAKPPAFDSDSYGKPVDGKPDGFDSDSYGEEVPAEGTEPAKPAQPPPGPEVPWSALPSVAGKSVGQGLVGGLVGAPMEGAGVAISSAARGASNFNKQSIETMDRIDRGEQVPASEDPIGYGAASPEQKAELRKQVVPTAEAKPEESGLGKAGARVKKAGEAVTKWGEETFPLSDPEKKTVTSRIAKGLATVAPLAALTAVAPEVGVPAGAAFFGLSSAGESYDAAIKEGATPDQAAKAAGLNGAVGAALGVLPIGSVLNPITKLLPEALPFVYRALIQAGQNGMVFATVGEAQEYLGQQIAAATYDPKAHYTFDRDRLLAELGLGAILGVGHAGLEKYASTRAKAKTDQDEKTDRTDPDAKTDTGATPGVGGPQPGTGGAGTGTGGTGAGTGAGAGGGRARSGAGGGRPTGSPNQGDHFDPNYSWGPGLNGTWYRDTASGRWHYNFRTGDWEQPAGAGAGAGQAGGQQQGPNAQQRGPNGQQQGDAARAEWQKQWESTPPRTPEEEAKFKKWKDSFTARTSKGLYGAMRSFGFTDEHLASANTKDLRDYVRDADILVRHGFSNDEIAGMSPKDMQAALDEAMGHGASFEEKKEEAEPGTRAAPEDLKAEEDLAKAQAKADQEGTHAQHEANNVPRGHAKWNDLDITIEAPAGGVRRGVAPDGTPFETTHPGAAYGYFRGVPAGADGQHPDVHIGPHLDAQTGAYVIDELDPKTGKFRQTKSFVGFLTPQSAIDAYLASSSKTRDMIGGINYFSSEDFVKLAREGGLAKPVAPKAAEQPDKPSSAPSAPSAPSAVHVDAVHGALRSVGEEPSGHPPEVIERAAQLHAAGMSPADALQAAPIQIAIETGALTEQKAREIYGDEKVTSVLDAKPAPERGVRPETLGAATGGKTAAPGAGEEAKPREELPSGGKAGKNAEAEHKPAEAGSAGQAATAGHPETGTGDAVRPAAGGKPTAESGRGTGAGVQPEAGAQPKPAKNAGKAPVKRHRELSLHQFIAAEGGIRPDDKNIADVKSILGRNNKFIPGHGPLIRKGGKYLDQLREAAAIEGYIERDTDTNVLLEAIENEERGTKQHPPGHTAGLTGAQQDQLAETKAERKEKLKELEAALAEHKIPISSLSPESLEATLLRMVQGDKPLDALESATMQMDRDADLLADQLQHGDIDDTFSLEDAFHALDEQPAHQHSEGAQAQGPEPAAEEAPSGAPAGGAAHGAGQGTEERPVAGTEADLKIKLATRASESLQRYQAAQQKLKENPNDQWLSENIHVLEKTMLMDELAYAHKFDPERAKEIQDYFDRAEGREPTAEPGAEGKPQLVIPGAEKISEAEQAKRAAAAGLKPKVAQKPADIGLFGDESQQTDLVDMAKKPPEMTREQLHAEIFDIADKIEATGAEGAEGFAKGVRSSIKIGTAKPDSLPFLRKRLEEFRAQGGKEEAKPKETFTLDDLLLGDQQHVKAYRQIMETRQPPIVANALGAASKRFEELVAEINAAGFKVNDVNSFNAIDKPEVREAKKQLSQIGGAVSRLLAGVTGDKGQERIGKDVAQVRELLAAKPDVDKKVNKAGTPKEPITIQSTAAHSNQHLGKWKGIASSNEGGRLAVDAYADTPEEARRLAKEKFLREFADRAAKREAKAKSDWSEIGKNEIGQTLYEDQRGVRSILEPNGIRVTEPVQLRPARGGMEYGVDRTKPGRREWLVAEPHPSRPDQKVEIAKPTLDPEVLAALRQQFPNVKEPTVRPDGLLRGPKDALDFVYGWRLAKNGKERPSEAVLQTGFDAYMHPQEKAPEAGPSDSPSALKAAAKADGFNTSTEFWHGTTHGRFTTFKDPTEENDTLGPAIYLSRHKSGAEFYGPGRDGDLLGPFWVRGKIVTLDTKVPFTFNEDGTVKREAQAKFALGSLRGHLTDGRMREPWGKDMTGSKYAREFWKRRGVAGLDTTNGLEVAIYDPANIRAGFTLDEAKPVSTEKAPADEFGDAFSSMLDDEFGTPPQAKPVGEPISKSPTPAKTPKTGPFLGVPGLKPTPPKSTPKPAAAPADEAMVKLTKLFGKKKGVGEASAPEFFDDAVYQEAKPLFIAAAEKFAEHKDDIGQLVRAMGRELRQSHGWDRETMENAEPYFRRFVTDVKTGKIDLAAPAEAPNIRTDEHPGTQGAGEETLGAMAPGEGEGAAGGGETGRGPSGGGESGAGPNRPPDEESPLPGTRGEGGGAPTVHPPQAGGSGKRDIRGARGGRTGRGRVSKAPAPDVAPEEVPNIPGTNFTITDEVNLGHGSETVKFRDNIAAIETLKRIEREERRATPEEQRILARYVGWGGLANAFRDPEGNLKPDWKDRGEELQSLLTDNEYRAARKSTRNAHYTSKTVVDAMWNAVRRLGFKGGLALELSAGTGNFIGLMPKDLAGRFIAVEYDSVTARIAKLLYPQETVLHAGLQQVPFPDGEALLNIGNPPFGAESLRFQYKPELNPHSIHNQFFLAGLDALRPGGVQALIVSRYLMDRVDKSARQEIAKKADLIGAIRLPDTAFKENARTEVVTDILFLQRRAPDEEKVIEEAILAANSRPEKDRGAEARRREATYKVPEWVNTDKIKDPLGGEDMEVSKYFIRNPHMVMGRLERSGTMRTSEEINVKLPKDADFGDMLDRAIKRLPENVIPFDKDVMEATLARHKTLSESLGIALAGHEVGHVEFDPNGKLSQVWERETPSGNYEQIKRPLTPDSPWSRQLLLDSDGKWYTFEPTSRADQLRKEIAELKRQQAEGKGTFGHDARIKAAEIDLKEAEKTGAKAKTVVGKRNIYERKYFPNNVVPAGMRLGPNKFDRLSDMVKLRDLTKKQLTLEAEDATLSIMEGNRKKLAAAYKAFVDKNGLLNDRNNSTLASELPDGALIMALEFGYRPPVTHAKAARTGEKVRPATATPAPILSRRVVPKYEAPTKADSPQDALSISLSERGKVDMERIGSLLGLTKDDAAAALSEGDKPLVYFNPETNEWDTSHAYLTGQVAKKLRAAKAANLDKNIKALEAVQPAKWGAEDVTVLMGANWVPPKVYTDFINHLVGGNSPVSYSKATNGFHFYLDDNGADKAKVEQWSTKDMPFDSIARGILNSRVPKVIVDTGPPDNTRYVDKEATALVELKAREIENEFADWVFRDPDRRQQLVDMFNEKFNTRVQRQHDGSHLTLPGKVPDPIIKMRRHQLNAIWRGIHERFMLLDHVVGAGKTFTAIARIMERRRMGLSRKPMVVVPNHLVEQWTADVYRLYPGAKVLAAGKHQFDSKNRRRLFAKIATGDWDLVVIPHSSFGFIGVAPETELRFLDGELRAALEAVEEAKEEAAGIGGFRKPFTVKEAERLVTTIENRMDSLRNARRERMLTFEQMGVDDLTVDEAHAFKNLFYSSRLADVRGMGDKHGSKKAFDLYTKIRVLRESPTGTVTFMTGTPISNSAVEMYTMMRYLAADELRDLGLEHFDSWRTQSVSASQKWEPTEAGGLKEVTRLGRYWSNMRSLMELYYSFTDAVPQEDINKAYEEDNQGAKFPIPRVKHGGRKEVIVKPTPAQVQILEDVIEGFNGLPGITDPDERNAQRLRLMDRARKVSLDARAVDGQLATDEKGGKLETMADNIARLYKQWDADAGTQLVFLDRGVPKSRGDAKVIKEYDALVAKRDAALAVGDENTYRALTDKLDRFNPNEIEELRRAQGGGWNAYDQLKKNLTARGIPADEIRFVQEANNDVEKKALFDMVNDGKVRVLIGSTERMGAGTNVQERIVGLHHGDVTWKPSDIEQREGRGIRQGNSLLAKYGDKFELEILAYATERTVDAKMWDLNATKLRMVNGIRKYDGSFTMEFEDEDAVSMAEMAALASGDPLLLERVKTVGEIDKLELLERAHRRKIFGIEDSITKKQQVLRDYPGRIKSVEAAAAEMATELKQQSARALNRSVKIEGTAYDSPMAAERAVLAALETQKAGNENAKYSINIDGTQHTNKESIEEALRNALGDINPFEATVDGKTLTRRNQMAHVIEARVTPFIGESEKGTHNIDLGRMLNSDLILQVDADPPYSRGYYRAELVLSREGRTLAASHASEKKNKGFSLQLARAMVDKLGDDINDVARSTGDWMRREIEEAKQTLPPLLEAVKQPFKQEAELNEKRARLHAIISELDARTKAAEGRHAPTAEKPEEEQGGALAELAAPKDFNEMIAALKAERETFQAKLQNDLSASGRFSIKIGNRTIVVTKNIGEGAPWRATYFEGGEPTGHIELRDVRDIAQALMADWRKAKPSEGDLSAPQFARAPVTPSTLHVDLGPFPARPDTPIAKQVQDYVVERGNANGVEFMVMIDAKGNVVSHGHGWESGTGMSEKIHDLILDPANSLAAHHNHPTNTGFSTGDFGFLAAPGMYSIWAHGNAGAVSRASLTPAARSIVRVQGSPIQQQEFLKSLAHRAMYNFFDPLERAERAGWITKDEALTAMTDLGAQVLARAGVIDYRSNLDSSRLVESLNLEPYLKRAVALIAGRLFRDRPPVSDRYSRRPESLFHRGDAGAVFERPATHAGRTPAPAAHSGDRAPPGVQAKASELGGLQAEPPFGEKGFHGNHPPEEEHIPIEEYVPEGKHPSLGFFGDPGQTIKQAKHFWTSTFQPELFSDRAFESDPLFARYKAASAQEKDALIRQSESQWNYWNKRGDAERIRFLDDIETATFGNVPPDPQQARMARQYRAMLDANWAEEKKYGSQAAFVEDYFPHIWESPEEWRAFSQTRSAQVGPTWFQKKRSIDYITEGLAAGLKLKYTNPVDIVVHRLSSGVDMRQRMDLLQRLKKMGLAWEGKQGGDQLVRRGWRAIKAPDRKEWVIAPDVQLLWKNAVEAKGLWQAEHAGGSIFRGWMALKNAWVPIKLSLSAFHPLHVLHIDQANSFARGWSELSKGHDLPAALKAWGEAVGTLPTLGMIHYFKGAKARAAWAKRPSQQTPEQKAIVALMTDGGFVPQLSEQLKIAAKRQLAVAYQKVLRGEHSVPEWRRFVSAALRRPIEKMQAPVFEKWIPALKAAAYLNEAAALLKRNPHLLTDDTKRRIALRAISKSIDNRYGEMFYGTLFWNRTVKDTAIGSFLSLGWQMGFIREAGGAAVEAITRPAGYIPPFKPSEGRAVAREASNKIPYVLAYTATAMFLAGLMSYLFSGEAPEGLDYVFPRLGGKNPDGSPRRITTMFYTREVPMFAKHTQERGGNPFMGGWDMLMNKLMFGPFKELLTNRDYYGYNIWDENEPVYKQVWHALKHLFTEQTNPMSITGAKRAAELSGHEFKYSEPSTWGSSITAKGVLPSIMGFGPAPAYAEKSALQNRIGYLYHQHVSPEARPMEEGELRGEKNSARNAILIARSNKDLPALQEAKKRGKAAGLSDKAMNMIGREPTDVYLFSRLPNSDQKAILKLATPEERKRYFQHAHQAVRTELYKEKKVPVTSGSNAQLDAL